MKKIIVTLIALAAMYSGAFSQTRNCGTMDYYQQRLQQDPSLAQRMAVEEEHIQKWTEEHAIERPDIASKFPAIPGFVVTGNEEADRSNYAVAKEAYEKQHPAQKTAQQRTAEEIEKANTERKKNHLIPVQQ